MRPNCAPMSPALDRAAKAPVVSGPAKMMTTSTIVPTSSRPRRLPPRPVLRADASRVATTHVSTARAMHGTATTTASGERTHSTSVASAAIEVAMPGIPVRPVAVRIAIT